MKIFSFILFAASLFIFTASVPAQTKRKLRGKAPAKTVQNTPPRAVEQPTIKTETLPAAPAKKNERADNSTVNSGEQSNAREAPKKANGDRRQTTETAILNSPFVYEFSQPQFYVSQVKIEHSADGKGKITFERQDLGEPVTDPVTISPAALERIKNLYAELDFLNSAETYQSPTRSYAHLGTMKLRRTEGERTREVEFNWTENKTAESLANEYKKLTEQFVWTFEIGVARENQPLEAPKLMDKLDALVKRNQISDAQQILPLLREVADDERLPLIARNHSQRIIKSIEKQAEKKSK